MPRRSERRLGAEHDPLFFGWSCVQIYQIWASSPLEPGRAPGRKTATVLVADPDPGQALRVDFCRRIGLLPTGKRKRCARALVFTACSNRHFSNWSEASGGAGSRAYHNWHNLLSLASVTWSKWPTR